LGTQAFAVIVGEKSPDEKITKGKNFVGYCEHGETIEETGETTESKKSGPKRGQGKDLNQAAARSVREATSS